MNIWFLPLLILFALSLCDLQIANAELRIVRSSQNSSRFIHHDEIERETATQEPSETEMCMFEETLNTTTDVHEDPDDPVDEEHRIERGHESMATISTKYGDKYIEETGSERSRRNAEIARNTDYHKSVKERRLDDRRRNAETPTSSGQYKFREKSIEETRSDRHRRSNNEGITTNHILKTNGIIRRKHRGQAREPSSHLEDIPRTNGPRTDLLTGRKGQYDETTTTETTTADVEDFYDPEFVKCEHTMIERGCFEKFSNGSVYVPLYKRTFGPRHHIETEEGSLYICSTFFDDHNGSDKFPRAIFIVTFIGTVVSTLCVVLHIIMFLLLKKLRNLPGYCLFSMCIALLVAYTCTFIPYARQDTDSDCTAVGIIKLYGFLASFFWMNAMAYDIWRSLRLATAKLRLSGDRPMMTRFAMYSAYSWGFPLVIITIGFIVNSSIASSSPHYQYRLEITNDRCWFMYKTANLLYFASPLFIMIFLNVLLFISSFVMISSATMNTAENKADLWSRFLVSFRLAVVMGLMWIFGILATAFQYATWLWYIYVIFNVLQGMFIFFSFTFTEKTRKECRKALTTKKSSLFPTLTTNSSQPSTTV